MATRGDLLRATIAVFDGRGEMIHEDPGRQAAIEVLLLMADADARWGDYGHAVSLLDSVEEIVGELPVEYAVKRSRWTRLEVIAGEPRLAAAS